MLGSMNTDKRHTGNNHTDNSYADNQHDQFSNCEHTGNMDIAEQAALLLLLERSNDHAKICEQVERCGSALALLYSGHMTYSTHDQQSLLPCADWEYRMSWDDRIDEMQTKIANWIDQGMSFAAFFDSEYPPQLLTIRERPPFVTWRGRIDKNDANGIAIIGTRHPSSSGLSTARSLAFQLSREGVTVISGLAEGIDRAAHQGALEAGGRSVGVIGTGLLHTYPLSNAKLQSQIAAAGAVISQFLPDTLPNKKNFPIRNATMSGYAGATLVIEASWRSGARLQARLATQHGRPLFFAKQMLDEEWIQQYLSLPGVHVIKDADDVIEAFGRYQMDGDTLEWDGMDGMV